jgi:hypothetical protein
MRFFGIRAGVTLIRFQGERKVGQDQVFNRTLFFLTTTRDLPVSLLQGRASKRRPAGKETPIIFINTGKR